MNLFQHIPEELFTILSSPNRKLYADALEVLYLVYQDALKIPEEQLYTALRGSLEEQLADADFDEDDIFEEEREDISGRARFLQRGRGGSGAEGGRVAVLARAGGRAHFDHPCPGFRGGGI